MKNYRKKFICAYAIFSVIIIVIISVLYIRIEKLLKENITNEYKNVYIENRKSHLKDIINHIFFEINKKRKKLKQDISKELSNNLKIYFNLVFIY